MNRAQTLLARLLATTALVVPAACSDDAATGSPAAGGSSGTGGTGGAGARAGTGGSDAAGSGGSGIVDPPPCGSPPGEGQTTDVCYEPTSIEPTAFAFCRGDLGAVRVRCQNGSTMSFSSWPSESPCGNAAGFEKNCSTGLVEGSAATWQDPCPLDVGEGAGGAAGVGGASGAGGSAGDVGMAGSAGNAGAGTAGNAGAGTAGNAGAGTAGNAGAGGTAAAAMAAQVCIPTSAEVLGGSTDLSAARVLACLGAPLPQGGGLGLPVSYGPLVASTEAGVPRCCHAVSVMSPGYACGRPLVHEDAPVVSPLVRSGDWSSMG